MATKYTDIDLELETIVFLWAAKELDGALCGLTMELAYYDLTIEDKYKIARQLVTSLIKDGLVKLEIFTDPFSAEKIETVTMDKVEEILNNPSSWYPGDIVYAIVLTEKGDIYLLEQTEKHMDKVNKRFASK